MPMTARAPDEAHRTSTPLELFFDLVFVVAIAQAADGLHHAIVSGHAGHGLQGFLFSFFAIWWAWMNFTWFASAYDSDDLPYRLLVFVQLTGALILAAGIPSMMETLHPDAAAVGGYVVMRLAMVVQWLRAARADPARRTTARRYAIGISTIQIAWVVLLFEPTWGLPVISVLIACEMAVPVWAERAEPTTWHPHHIAERYGLMTIIVLGESILSATVAVEAAFASGQTLPSLLSLIAGGLLVVFAFWWLYFDRPVHDLLTTGRRAFVWGYGHYLVFVAAAAVGAGLAAAVDVSTGHATIGPVAGRYAVAIPVLVFLFSLWVLHDRPEYRRTRWVAPLAAPVILAAPLVAHGVLIVGLTLAGIVAIRIRLRRFGP